jgi:nitrate reductase beta subunit
MAVLQLFRATQQIITRFEIEEGEKVYETVIDGKPWAMYNDTAIGYNQDGEEVARVKVEEPSYIRSDEHLNSI